MPIECDTWLTKRYKVRAKFSDAVHDDQDAEIKTAFRQTVADLDQDDASVVRKQKRQDNQDEWDRHYDVLGMS